MELIRQKHPDGCGAACLAMVRGITYEEARVILPGYTSKTRMRDLCYKQLPNNIFLDLVGNSEFQHWVVRFQSVYYDPAMKQPTRTLNKKYESLLYVIC
jgi:hypothetical protein